ncbi:MAG: hypothetical protein C4519_26715 [Desulfobacteraceae bacterium]|nr:MAG: hypothetical protein C4519_26715 [Desulfobacteraceae bacterium]
MKRKAKRELRDISGTVAKDQSGIDGLARMVPVLFFDSILHRISKTIIIFSLQSAPIFPAAPIHSVSSFWYMKGIGKLPAIGNFASSTFIGCCCVHPI